MRDPEPFDLAAKLALMLIAMAIWFVLIDIRSAARSQADALQAISVSVAKMGVR